MTDIVQKTVCLIRNERINNKAIGARPMFYKLGIDFVGINKFEKIMSESNLGVKLKRKRIITTQGLYENHDKNLISGLTLNDINQVIAGDITYLITKEKTFFIFTLKDMYSKRILGLIGSDNMMAVNAYKLLKESAKLRGKAICNCIHHSDAGKQYKSNIYKKLLKEKGMKMSIAENCLENGMAEQLNGLIKNGYITEDIRTVRQLNKVLNRVKKTLNEEIPVKAIGYKTPVAFEQKLKDIPFEKRIKIELYDFKK